MNNVILKLVRKYKTNDPFELADRLNISVRFHDLGKGTRGLYIKKLKRRYIIIHKDLDFHWSRFVCAHELGHDRLHPGLNRFWLDEKTFFNADKFERQANKFAIRLLTSKEYIEHGESIEDFLRRNNIPPEMNKFYY